MLEDARNWIKFAAEDLQMADLAFQAGIYNQTCFHAQQCVEKILKAYLVKDDIRYPHSHKLSDILELLESTFLEDTRGEILALDRFYIPTRYPNALPGMLPEGLPNKVDASEAVEVARLVFEKVKAQLGTK